MLPRHPKAKHLQESGLFNDLTCFSQLEFRLSSLADPQEQQAGFALFAEGVLLSRSLHRAVEIWPSGQLPLDARRRLALPEVIPGADGVFRSLEGEVHGYQLLFRPDREKPTSLEVERFLSLVSGTLEPMLFTNCDSLPNSWKKLKNFHCIRGVDLDRLEPRLFVTLRRWLQGAGATIERPVTPSFHVGALEKIQTLLATREQATLLLPPGSEPELLTLRMMQRLGGRRVVLVVLESFDQLIHTVRVWRNHAGWGDLACLQLVEESQAATPWELDFPLTHHPDGVRRFLAWHHTGLRVILATYGTVPLLSRAMMGFPVPDLMVGCGVSEPGLLATKRLMLQPVGKQARGVSQDVTVETLPFPRPWQLLLLPVSTNKPAEHPWAITASVLQWVGQQEAIRQVHLHLPESAPRPGSQEEGPESARLTLFHLTGEQAKKLTERDRLMHNFYRAKRGVLIHSVPMVAKVRFLSADLVIFLTSPGGSRLVEALTPILTPGSSGAPGLILLPVYHKEGVLADNDLLWEVLRGLLDLDGSFGVLVKSCMEQLGREGRFELESLDKRIKLVTGEAGEPAKELEKKVIATCLQRLGDPWDQRFGELQSYIQQNGDGAIPDSWSDNPHLAEWAMRQRKAKAKQSLPVEQLAQLESIGFVWDLAAFAWDNLFRRLERFITRHGHAKIPEQYLEDPELAMWTSQQRHLKKKGKLDLVREERLEAVHFVWDLAEAAWEESFQLFFRFKKLRGHGKIPSHFPEDLALGKWAEKQRKDYQLLKLDPTHQARLDAEGFVWDLAVAAWEEMLETLRAYRAQYGHGLVPKEWPTNPTLAIWAEEQRRLFDKGVLAADRIDRLNAIDFVWDLKKARWEEGFTGYCQFKEHNGHGKVPDPYLDSMLLDQWAKEVRRDYRLDRLTPQIKARLDAAGFVWDLEVAAWEESCADLARFKELHGHVAVVEPCLEFPLLPGWVQTQRRARLKGTLSAEWVQKLDELEFIWDPAEKFWNDMFQALTDFYHQQGHFNVPKEWSVPAELFGWVKAQRLAKDKEKLDLDKLARFVALGFVWDAQEAVWEEMYLALTRFQQQRNHCLVPNSWTHTPGLARWVEQQRRDYRLKTLSSDRIERLESLGFIWDAKAIFWEEMFAALTEYREGHGDCLVPDHYAEQSQLSWWVAAQRKARLSGQLEPERLQRLDAIGFVWDAQEVIWQESFRALVEFRSRFGHCIVPADWPENPRLSTWVMAQRNARVKGHLGTKREETLTAIGMIWDPKEAVAEEMLLQLAAFQERHGHCDVPLDNQEYPRLGMWVQFQRQSKKDGNLDPVRFKRLEKMGLEWK